MNVCDFYACAKQITESALERFEYMDMYSNLRERETETETETDMNFFNRQKKFKKVSFDDCFLSYNRQIRLL